MNLKSCDQVHMCFTWQLKNNSFNNTTGKKLP